MLHDLGFGIQQNSEEAVQWWEHCSKTFPDSVPGLCAMNTLALYYSTPDCGIDKEKVHII